MRTSFFACLLLASCTTKQASPTDGLVTTLDLTLHAPSPGTPEMPNTSLDAVFDIDALTDDGSPYGGDAVVDIYVSYGGILTGLVTTCGADNDSPIETITIHGGHLANHSLKLPAAYGTTSIWASERGSHVVGASTPIYFPNPTIEQIQTPPDPTSADATFCSNFNHTFVVVDHPQAPTGAIVIDSIFNGAVVAVDTSAQTYNAIYLFTFGAPATDVVHGRVLSKFSGNIAKFSGFTEVNFPIITTDDTTPADPSKLPAPITLAPGDITNEEKLNSYNARTVIVSGAICPVAPANPRNDSTIQQTIDQWTKYNTFTLGQGTICDSFNDFSVQLPSKVVGTFDPANSVGKLVTVRGMLKNSSGQNNETDTSGNTIACDSTTPCAAGTCVNGLCKKGAFNFWTVQVRDSSDLPQ